MNQNFRLSFSLIILSSSLSVAAPLLQKSDLQYLGSIRIPSGYEYGGNGLAFNPARNSLFFCGNTDDMRTSEISIPSIGGTASVLQGFTSATEGKDVDGTSGDRKIGGQMVYKGKLYITKFVYYDSGTQQTRSHFSRSLDLSQKSVTGPTRVGSMGAGFYSGYMTQVPAAWQAALGGPALTGNCCLSIISRTSFGPAVSSFDPENMGTANPLVYYTDDNAILGNHYGDTGKHPVFNGSTRITGIVFPEGTDSVLFLGATGVGNYCYGEQSTCGCENYKGEHACPYTGYVWAYSAHDLAAAKAGTKKPWEVMPYATWEISEMANLSKTGVTGGAAYDPATNRIYFAEISGGSNGSPLIHVYQVKAGSTLPPTSACDLNGDNATNVTDVQQCVNQAIGSAACASGDINKDNACNVVDVQRVVNAALGGACATQ